MSTREKSSETAKARYVPKIIKWPPRLWDELERQVPVKQRAAFVRRAVARELGVAEDGELENPEVKPAWLQLYEIGQSLPEEERARFPPDASENVDHYLYGAPKRTS